MEFRESKMSDLNDLINIIEDAKLFLKDCGINQWQDGYPGESDIAKDIDNSISYVLTDSGKIIGTASISFEKETTYNNIYNGSWLTNNEYVVIHRVAVHNDFKRKGIFSIIIKEAENLALEKDVFSIKIDTHSDNKVMQNSLSKNGFKKCGIIYLKNGDKRIAFEKLI